MSQAATVPLVEVKSETIAKISNTYQRDPASLQDDVTTLKTWMQTQPHLPEILDDKRIQNFLFLNKCSIERAKRSIDMYYTLRSKIPDIFENINPKCENMKRQMQMSYWVLLPKLTDDMYRVQVFKIRDRDMMEVMEPRDMMCLGLNLQEIRLKEDVMFGDVYIFDMEGTTFGYLTKMTPSFLAKIVAIHEKVYRIPLKAAYFVNSPKYVTVLMAIMKKLMKPKLFERIHVCEDTSILARLPKEILPKDYGGEEKSLEELQELVKMKLSDYADRFDQLDSLRVDEDLRPQELNNDEVLGFHGNFKKLNVD